MKVRVYENSWVKDPDNQFREIDHLELDPDRIFELQVWYKKRNPSFLGRMMRKATVIEHTHYSPDFNPNIPQYAESAREEYGNRLHTLGIVDITEKRTIDQRRFLVKNHVDQVWGYM